MEIMPVPTCCKLHAHNYTCIPIILGRRGTLYPTGQLVKLYHTAFEHSFPLRTIGAKSKNIKREPWFSNGLLTSSKKRAKLLTKKISKPTKFNIHNLKT